MPPDLEQPSGPASQAVTNDYDSLAEAYAAETESNLINGYYTRPAILDLAGDVGGRRIPDVGCGAGPLLAVLHQGGPGGDPLPFSDSAFDDAIACLVLHYLEDWETPLTELRRALVPCGRLLPYTLTSSLGTSSVPSRTW